MATESKTITVSGIKVEVVRKEIRNLHLGVYPPHGRVRVAAPLVLSDDAIRLAVIDKLGWIKRHQTKFAEQPRQSQREMVNGETHYFLGRRYRLRVHEETNTARASIRGLATLDLYVRPGSTREQRERVLARWYREQLATLVPPILDKWQPQLGIETPDWGIRKMKTKWGSCNASARRVWLNLELAKKPVQCLEYIVVHELLHLLERHHNDRFFSLLDHYMPDWRLHRDELNRGMLAHENWDY